MYLSHPGSYYFGVGRLDEDQILDWAERKGTDSRDICRRIGRI
jgi:5-methyltetrahydrofolate--homocysteine methyltransferase